jgi:D-sedoheptulose 7-phosphate isomerase
MDFINGYLRETQHVLSEMPDEVISHVIALLFEAWKQGNQVFIFGNGGSASTASHMANDLSKATIVAGKPRMKVIALTDNISLITAWANDTSYECIFKEQLENLLRAGDLVIGISASGNSPNVLRAMEFASEQGAITVGWTGRTGGSLKDVVHVCVHSPTDDIGMIESTHLVLDHLVTRELRTCIESGKITWGGPESISKRANGNGHRHALFSLTARPRL